MPCNFQLTRSKNFLEFPVSPRGGKLLTPKHVLQTGPGLQHSLSGVQSRRNIYQGGLRRGLVERERDPRHNLSRIKVEQRQRSTPRLVCNKNRSWGRGPHHRLLLGGGQEAEAVREGGGSKVEQKNRESTPHLLRNINMRKGIGPHH